MFSIEELVAEARRMGASQTDSTLRTHLSSVMCTNAPQNHLVKYHDLIRIERGQYRRHESSAQTTSAEQWPTAPVGQTNLAPPLKRHQRLSVDLPQGRSVVLSKRRLKFVCEISPEVKSGRVVEEFPHLRYKNTRRLSLHKFGSGPFVRFRIPGIHIHAGVYAITVGGEVVYVGEAKNLARRFNAGYGQISPRNCYDGGQSTNCRINGLIAQKSRAGNCIQLWFMETPNYKAVESEILRASKPPWNIQSS